jgi:hypothetical protein
LGTFSFGTSVACTVVIKYHTICRLQDTVSAAGFQFTQQKISDNIIILPKTIIDNYFNPKLELIHCVQCLRKYNIIDSTLLNIFFDTSNRPCHITDLTHTTSTFRMGAALLNLDTNATVGSLWCMAATAALEGNIASNSLSNAALTKFCGINSWHPWPHKCLLESPSFTQNSNKPFTWKLMPYHAQCTGCH